METITLTEPSANRLRTTQGAIERVLLRIFSRYKENNEGWSCSEKSCKNEVQLGRTSSAIGERAVDMEHYSLETHTHISAVEDDPRNGGWITWKQKWEETGIKEHKTNKTGKLSRRTMSRSGCKQFEEEEGCSIFLTSSNMLYCYYDENFQFLFYQLDNISLT